MAGKIQVGDLTKSFSKGAEGADRDPKVTPEPPPDYDPAISATVLIEELTRRLLNLENAISLKVDSGRILSEIRLTEEALLITADKIAVVGDVTFIDYIRDHNGEATGVLDPRITRIRGDVIQTGLIKSNNWGADNGTLLDLNNGAVIIGGLDEPRLVFLDEDYEFAGSPASLNVRGNIKIWDAPAGDATELGFFKTGSAGYTIVDGFTGSGVLMGTPGVFGGNAGNLTFALDAATGDFYLGEDVLNEAGLFYDAGDKTLEVIGTIAVKDSVSQVGMFTTGTATWDGSTSATGTGVIIGTLGIAGIKNNVLQFAFETATGNALFGGDVITAGRIEANSTGLTSAGSFINTGTSGPFGGAGVSGVGIGRGVTGTSTSGIGVYGSSTGGTGVVGIGNHANGFGGVFSNELGTALRIDGTTLAEGHISFDIDNLYDIGAVSTRLRKLWSQSAGINNLFTEQTDASIKFTKSSNASGLLNIYDSGTSAFIATYKYTLT